MNVHIISGGVVQNTISAESIEAAQDIFQDDICIEATQGGPGWLWDGATLTPPPPAPVQVPQSVSMRQACLALENAGILDDVEALVSTLPRPYQIEWQRASTVDRDNMLVEVVRAQQGMTVQQIDDLFVLADSL